LDGRTVSSLVHYCSDRMSSDDLNELIGVYLRLPAPRWDTREEAVDAVLDVYDVLTGNAVPSTLPTALIMTDACDPDGRVTGRIHSIPTGAHRVYAVFENDRSLAGRPEVYAVWRDPVNDRLVFIETEPIHVGARYNYVWLELADGWPAGRYQLELFDPARPSQLLASETFTVR
jgi:hypothetical protein